jgi:excisionase family DNA binding protein
VTYNIDGLLDDLADRLADRLVPRLSEAVGDRLHPAGLSTEQAGIYLGVSGREIRRMIARGDLAAVKVGGRVLVPRERLDAILGAA